MFICLENTISHSSEISLEFNFFLSTTAVVRCTLYRPMWHSLSTEGQWFSMGIPCQFVNRRSVVFYGYSMPVCQQKVSDFLWVFHASLSTEGQWFSIGIPCQFVNRRSVVFYGYSMPVCQQKVSGFLWVFHATFPS